MGERKILVKQCTICGSDYETKGSWSKYCPTCAADAHRASSRKCDRRRRGKPPEPAGERLCSRCGGPIGARGSNAKYCKECSRAKMQEYILAKNKANYHEKIKNMSPEELAAFRQKRHETYVRWRENLTPDELEAVRAKNRVYASTAYRRKKGQNND